MNRVYIHGYKHTSDSAKKMKRILGARWLPHDRLIKAGSVIVNWGSSTQPRTKVPMINKPEAVAIAANKLATYRVLKAGGVRVPAYTTSFKEAVNWGADQVVSRFLVAGHGGAGIEIGRYPNQFAKYFTKYVKKEREFRVHCFPSQQVTLVHEKRRALDVPDDAVNWAVRNHDNGFIYASEPSAPIPLEVCHVARDAVIALGLHFGAADVILTKSGKAFVLEVNTAPGLFGSTKYEYARYINKIAMSEYGVDI